MKRGFKIAAALFTLSLYLIIINGINPDSNAIYSHTEKIKYMVDEKFSDNSVYKMGIFVYDNGSFGYSDFESAVAMARTDYPPQGNIYCNIIEKIEWSGDSLLVMINTEGDTCREYSYTVTEAVK